MDGAPVKGESIPIRVFLAGYDLTPTMRDINKKFSVKYYLNLVRKLIFLWGRNELLRQNHFSGSCGRGGEALLQAAGDHALEEGGQDEEAGQRGEHALPGKNIISVLY